MIKKKNDDVDKYMQAYVRVIIIDQKFFFILLLQIYFRTRHFLCLFYTILYFYFFLYITKKKKLHASLKICFIAFSSMMLFKNLGKYYKKKLIFLLKLIRFYLRKILLKFTWNHKISIFFKINICFPYAIYIPTLKFWEIQVEI